MNIKVDFDNIVVKEDKNDFNVKVLMLKGEKGDQGDGEPNVIEKVQVNGTDLPVTNKTVNVPVPTVDSALSPSSTNPVQNKVIYNALSNKVDNSALNNYYEISEVDALLNGKIDTSYISKINKKPYYFNSVAEMKSYNLQAGDYAITKGYYSANDGGGANYEIVDDDNLVDDGGIIHSLTNGLYAKLIIINNVINIKQLGAKSTSEDLIKNDIKQYIEKYINLLDNDNYNLLKLYIPGGGYYCSQLNISREKGFYIYGDKGFTIDTISGTVISSYNDNQDYIFNIGSQNNYTYNWKLENLYFTSCDYKYDNGLKLNKNNVKRIDYALNLLYAITGMANNLFFGVINGGGIQICSSWENYFNSLNFRYMYNIEDNIINFKTVNTALNVNANITANSFDSIFVEGVFAKRIINFELNSGTVNNNFGVINFEETWVNINNLNVTKTSVDISNWDDYASDVIHMALFGGFTTSATINSINIDVIGVSYLEYNDEKYIYDTIFTHDINLGGMNIATSNIEIDNCTNTIKLYRLKNGITTNLYTRNIVNNILNKGSNKIIYDVEGFTYLQCNSPLNKFGSTEQDVLKLQNNITPAYKLINVFGGGTYGLLYSNQNADNDLKICVKPFPQNATVNSMTMLKYGTELHLNALIPNNEVVKIILHSGSVNEPFELTGTGSFEEYTCSFPSNLINSGYKDVGIRISGSSTSKNILIDYVYIK